MKYFTFGTCRIANFDAIKNYKFPQYLHNTKNIIQAIKILRGEIDLSEFILKYLVICESNYTCMEEAKKHFLEADVYVIEISSIYEYTHGNIYIDIVLKQNLDLYVDKEYEYLSLSTKATLQAISKNLLELKNKYNELRKYINIRMQDESEFINDLRMIQSLLEPKKIIFVPHINLKINNGNYIMEREFIHINLKKFYNNNANSNSSNSLTVYLFDINEYLKNIPLDKVFITDKDYYHYSKNSFDLINNHLNIFLNDMNNNNKNNENNNE